MSWILALLILAVGLFLWRGRPKEEVAAEIASPQKAETMVPADESMPDEDEFIAFITAVVAEYERGGDFQAISFKPGNRNWTLTARQELLQSRI